MSFHNQQYIKQNPPQQQKLMQTFSQLYQQNLSTPYKHNASLETYGSLMYTNTDKLPLYSHSPSVTYDLIENNASCVSFNGEGKEEVKATDAQELIEAMRYLRFLAGNCQQKYQYIANKQRLIRQMTKQREELENKLYQQNKTTNMKRNTLINKQQQVIEQRTHRKLRINEEIKIMKDKIIRIKTQHSEEKYTERKRTHRHYRMKSECSRQTHNQHPSVKTIIYLPMPVIYPYQQPHQQQTLPHYQQTLPHYQQRLPHYQQTQPHQQYHQKYPFYNYNNLKQKQNSQHRRSATEINENYLIASTNPVLYSSDKMQKFKNKLGEALLNSRGKNNVQIQQPQEKKKQSIRISKANSKLSQQMKKKSSRLSKHILSDYSDDQDIRDILKCSNLGESELLTGTQNIKARIQITQSSDPYDPFQKSTLQLTNKQQLKTIRQQINQSTVNFGNVTLNSSKKGNNSDSRERMAKISVKDPGESGKMKIRQSQVNIDISRQIDCSQSDLFNDEQTYKRYRSIETDTLKDDLIQKSKTLQKQYTVNVIPDTSKIQEQQFADQLESQRKLSDRKQNTNKIGQNNLKVEKFSDQDDQQNDIYQIKLDPQSQISRLSIQKAQLDNNNRLNSKDHFLNWPESEQDDLINSIRLSTQSRISLENKSKSLKGSISDIRSLQKSRGELSLTEKPRVYSSEMKQTAKSGDLTETHDLFTVQQNGDWEDMESQLRNSTKSSVVKKGSVIHKSVIKQVSKQINDSIEEADEQAEIESKIISKSKNVPKIKN